MGFMEAVRHVLTHYATIKGRARRSEYWFFALFGVILSLICSAADTFLGTFIVVSGYMRIPLIASLLALVLFIPSLCVGIRRMHDIDKGGLWYFIYLIPLVGPIILLIWLVRDGDPGDNRFGPSPKAVYGGVATTVRRDAPEASAPRPPVGVATTQKRPVDDIRTEIPGDMASQLNDIETTVPQSEAPLPMGAAMGPATMVTQDVVTEQVAAEPIAQPAEVPQPSGPRRSFAILAVAGPLQGDAYPLEGHVTTIGRERTGSVVFPESTPGVSARHCEIVLGESGPVIRDLGSSYGTFVGGRKINASEAVPLSEGDTFWLGMEDNCFTVIVFSA